MRYPEQTLGEEPRKTNVCGALKGLHPAEHRNSAKLVNDELPAAKAGGISTKEFRDRTVLADHHLLVM